jgi:Tol biopolymer transport system component
MKHLALAIALSIVVWIAGCTDPSAPDGTGGITLRLITSEQAAAASAATPTDRGATASREHLDAARVRVIGPSGPSSRERVRNLSPGPTGAFVDTIVGLEPGTYQVVVEGLVGGEVDFFGVNNSVGVTAGQNRTATITFNSFRPQFDALPSPTTDMVFLATYAAVPGADTYEAQLAADPGFANVLGSVADVVDTEVLISLFDLGLGAGVYYVRARAFNSFVPNGGRWGDPAPFEVVTDIAASGDDASTAPFLGFGSTANGIYGNLNILPETDEDWFAFSGCLDDSVTIATVAQRLDPPSSVDTFLDLFDGPGTTLVAFNDDLNGSLDSRLGLRLPADDTYNIRITSFINESAGHYLLDLEVVPGPNNTGASCGTPTPMPAIAFTSDRDGDEEIYVGTAGGTITQLTFTDIGSFDNAPAWSPDGSQIAFVSDRDGDYEIYVMNADGTGQTNLTNNPAADDMSPAWSPDGSQIAFVSDRDDINFFYDVFVMDVASPASPRNLTNNPGIDDVLPTWSPDGLRIAFTTDRDIDYEIYVMDADGSNPSNLSSRTGSDELYPAWSPDGTRIAFSSDRDDPVTFTYEIYLMDPTGAGQARLTNDPGVDDFDPTWSPDASRLAFTSFRDGNLEIYIINADGSNEVNITNNTASDYLPDWNPSFMIPVAGWLSAIPSTRPKMLGAPRSSVSQLRRSPR